MSMDVQISRLWHLSPKLPAKKNLTSTGYIVYLIYYVIQEDDLFIALSPSNPDPLYKQLTDQIKDAIASGDLKPGEKLPSVRELSEALKISAITIKRAYLDLENEGYILTRAGLGSFVADVNREDLRSGKLDELRAELRKLLRTAERFGISVQDVVRLIREISEG
jgi:GntR family transcriptional regulator